MINWFLIWGKEMQTICWSLLAPSISPASVRLLLLFCKPAEKMTKLVPIPPQTQKRMITTQVVEGFNSQLMSVPNKELMNPYW